MDRDETKSVLVVSEAATETSALESALTDVPADVTLLTDPDCVFEELTYATVHCLVLPRTIDDRSGTDVAYGITAMFPDVPVVVAGVDPGTIPAELDVIAVDSPSLVAPDVVGAIEDALDEPSPSVAGRPPSPMETLLLSLFNEMPDNLYAKDDEARHVLMGRGFNDPTDRLGLTDPEVAELPDEHAEAAYHDEMAVVEGEKPRVDVEEFLDLEASYVRTRKVPWYDREGTIRGLVGITQDITPQKTREHAFRRQHERMVKVALVAAHELRNELQIAHGRLELLEDDSSQLASIEHSLSRLSSLVDTVVQLSTREHIISESKPVWFSRLAREIWDTLADGRATLDVEGDAKLVADQESASLLLQFLFRNTIEHAGPEVTVTVGPTADGFFVADDGPGIDASPAERVFDAGFTTVDGNTGFGLYIARMVAEDQDWTLSLSTDTDDGARFDIGNVDIRS